MSPTLRASWVISPISPISLLLWLFPVFPMTVGKTHLLARYLPCWTLEISYFIDSCMWVIVTQQNVSVVHDGAGTGIKSARIDHE